MKELNTFRQFLTEDIIKENKNSYNIEDISKAYVKGVMDGIGVTEPKDRRFDMDLSKLKQDFLKKFLAE